MIGRVIDRTKREYETKNFGTITVKSLCEAYQGNKIITRETYFDHKEQRFW